MSLHAFGFDSTRLHALFAPRKPRHPLLRGLAGLLGLALLALLLAAGLLLRLWRRRARPLARARRRDAMDAEYRVIERGGLPHPN
jgi:hypothetical protein